MNEISRDLSLGWLSDVYPILHTRTTVEYMPIDGLVQDCSNSIANTLELLQSCTKPSMS